MSLLNDRPAAVDDYDPMIYDVMREAANRLRGKYLALANAAIDEQQRERFEREQRRVWLEAREVHSRDRAAVEAKTNEFTERLRTLSVAE